MCNLLSVRKLRLPGSPRFLKVVLKMMSFDHRPFPICAQGLSQTLI